MLRGACCNTRWRRDNGPDKADRLVLQCEQCPEPRRSRRRAPRWARVAREVVEAVGADPRAVRSALEAALAGERERTERHDTAVVSQFDRVPQARFRRRAYPNFQSDSGAPASS